MQFIKALFDQCATIGFPFVSGGDVVSVSVFAALGVEPRAFH